MHSVANNHATWFSLIQFFLFLKKIHHVFFFLTTTIIMQIGCWTQDNPVLSIILSRDFGTLDILGRTSIKWIRRFAKLPVLPRWTVCCSSHTLHVSVSIFRVRDREWLMGMGTLDTCNHIRPENFPE